MNLELIDKQVNDIIYGTTDIPRFNQQEHAGICSAGSSLIGALLVCYDTRKSLETSADASGSKGTPTNWEIDEAQEKAVQNWAEAKNIWVPDCENWLIANFGQMIAEEQRQKFFIGQETSLSLKNVHLFMLLLVAHWKRLLYITTCFPRP